MVQALYKDISHDRSLDPTASRIHRIDADIGSLVPFYQMDQSLGIFFPSVLLIRSSLPDKYGPSSQQQFDCHTDG